MSKGEAKNKIMQVVGVKDPSRAESICNDIDNESLPLPAYRDSNIIGNWLIP